eukprot:67772-Chlamydomonas_euryale.AAC.1
MEFDVGCVLHATHSTCPARATNINKAGLSCRFGITSMPFPTRIASRASPVRFSQMPKQPLLSIPNVVPPTCIVSYHPASRPAGQFSRRILGYGNRFASLWAHLPPMLTLLTLQICLATRLELAPRRCIILETVLSFDTPLAFGVLH